MWVIPVWGNWLLYQHMHIPVSTEKNQMSQLLSIKFSCLFFLLLEWLTGQVLPVNTFFLFSELAEHWTWQNSTPRVSEIWLKLLHLKFALLRKTLGMLGWHIRKKIMLNFRVFCAVQCFRMLAVSFSKGGSIFLDDRKQQYTFYYMQNQKREVHVFLRRDFACLVWMQGWFHLCRVVMNCEGGKQLGRECESYRFNGCLHETTK